MGKGQSQQGKNLELQARPGTALALGLGGADGPDGQQRRTAGRGDWAVVVLGHKIASCYWTVLGSALPRFHNARLETSGMRW